MHVDWSWNKRQCMWTCCRRQNWHIWFSTQKVTFGTKGARGMIHDVWCSHQVEWNETRSLCAICQHQIIFSTLDIGSFIFCLSKFLETHILNVAFENEKQVGLKKLYLWFETLLTCMHYASSSFSDNWHDFYSHDFTLCSRISTHVKMFFTSFDMAASANHMHKKNLHVCAQTCVASSPRNPYKR